MDFLSRNAGVIALVAIVIAIGGYFYPQLGQLAGSLDSATTYGILGTGQIKVGSNCASGPKFSSCGGTAINGISWATCSLISSNFVVTASTTAIMDCAVTGALSSDAVFAMFATSTASGAGWEILGASASTTAGFDTIAVTNGTGANAVIPASIASTTKVLNLR